MATLRSKRAQRRTIRAIIPAHPGRIEDDAAREMLRRHNRALAAVLAKLEPELRRALRADAPGPDPVTSAQGVLDLLSAALRAYIEGFPPDLIERIFRKHADRVDLFNRRQIRRAFEPIPGINPIADEAIEDLLRAALRESVGKITTIRTGLFEEITDTIMAAFARGARPETVAKEIGQRWGVAASRIKFVVRNELGNLNAKVNERRQVSVGVTHYFWETSKDEKVRPTHQELQGVRIAWNAPPAVGHPGADFNCRCRPRPDLSGVIGNLEEEEPTTQPLRSRQARRRAA